MNNIQTAERIKKELKNKKKTITNMIDDLKLSKSFMQNLTKQGSKPSIETMEHIAEYLGVSIDYLIGREEINNNPKIENSNVANTGGTNTININRNEDVSYLEMELVQEIKKLSKAEQIQLLATLNKE